MSAGKQKRLYADANGTVLQKTDDISGNNTRRTQGGGSSTRTGVVLRNGRIPSEEWKKLFARKGQGGSERLYRLDRSPPNIKFYLNSLAEEIGIGVTHTLSKRVR